MMTREEAIEVYNGLINTKIKEAFEFFAPELRESEDERIRKELIAFLKYYHTGEGNYIEFSDKWIKWLEKQKDTNLIKLTDNAVRGLDRALMIVKDAKGELSGYQSDDGIYECDHAIETLENILNTVQ
jgi:hypothetical protein